MRTIKVEISWADKNYCCGWGLQEIGAILCTNNDVEVLKAEFEEALRYHIEVMVETGESIPQWLLSGEYTIEYSLSVSALLRQAMYYTSISAVSRFTGINQRLLNEYSCTTKKPRRAQHDIIIQGLHNIGQRLLAIH